MELADSFNKPGKLSIKGYVNVHWYFVSASSLVSVGDRRKKLMLIILIAVDGQEIFDNFRFAKLKDKVSFQIVMDRFQAFCAPKKNLTIERFNFFNLVQSETEPFESCLTELRKKTC